MSSLAGGRSPPATPRAKDVPTSPATSPFTPLAQRNSAGLRGLGGNQWQELLQMCQSGVAAKLDSISQEIVGEIRIEVTDAVNAFRREAGSATLAADRPVGSQLGRVEERLMRLEKMISLQVPAPDLPTMRKEIQTIELSCLNATRLFGEQLEALAKTSSQTNDKIAGSESHLTDVLRRLEDKVNCLEDKLQRSDSQIGGDVTKVQYSLNGAAAQIVGEVQKLQIQDEKHFAELDKTCAEAGQQVKKGLDQLTQMNGQISDQINLSGSNVSQLLQRIEGAVKHSEVKLAAVQDMQQNLQQVIEKEVRTMQKQDDRHYTDMGFILEHEMTNQRVQLENVQGELQRCNVVGEDIQKARVQQTMDFRTVLGELSRVQQALHIDYLRVPRGSGNELEVGEEPFRTQTKRVREFFTQTVPKAQKDASIQTDPRMAEDGNLNRKLSRRKSTRRMTEPEKKVKPAFAGAEKLKQAAKEASLKPPYSVLNYYHKTGCCQYIARSVVLENLSLLLVVLNAVWIAIDTDLNPAAMFIDSGPIFKIVEIIFCTYFTLELLIRFGAFQKKTNCLRDGWFIFDSCLVLLMLIETLVVTGIMMALQVSLSGEANGMSILRMAKMVKLVRLSRMARLLRSVPELIIIVKGLRFASRSVGVFFLLWGMIVYLFAVLFRQLTDGQAVGIKYFPSVPAAMNTLLLNGVFSDSAATVNAMTDGNWFLWPIIVFFMALVSLTLMYMLVGVLVDVVGVVAATEKEGIAVSSIAQQLRLELSKLGYKEEQEIYQQDFNNIVQEPSILKIMHGFGVDVIVLADMMDLIFEQFSKGTELMKFPDLVDVVLSMRGTNPATVKDCKEQIRVTKSLLQESMEELLQSLKVEIGKMPGAWSDGHSGHSDASQSDDDP